MASVYHPTMLNILLEFKSATGCFERRLIRAIKTPTGSPFFPITVYDFFNSTVFKDKMMPEILPDVFDAFFYSNVSAFNVDPTSIVWVQMPVTDWHVFNMGEIKLDLFSNHIKYVITMKDDMAGIYFFPTSSILYIYIYIVVYYMGIHIWYIYPFLST